MASDPVEGAPSAASEGLVARGLSSLRIHRRQSKVMWAHVHGLGVARSEDGGKSWQPMMMGIPPDERPGPHSEVRISLDPEKPEILYVVIDGRVYRTDYDDADDDDNENEWRAISSGSLAVYSWDRLKTANLSWDVRVNLDEPLHLLVGTRSDGRHHGGLFESTNGGKTWDHLAGTQKRDSNLGHDTWLVRLDPKTEKNVVVAGRTSLWYSDDRGRTFSRNDPGGDGPHDIRWLSEFAGKGRDLYMADARGIWHSKDAGKKWGKKPLRKGDALFVAIDRDNKRRVFAIFRDRGIEMSDDPRHGDWTLIGGKPDDPNAGYSRALPREIVFHPRDDDIVYFTSPVTGLYLSTDAGKTFAAVAPAAKTEKEAAVIPEVVPPMMRAATHSSAGGAALAIDDHGMVYRSPALSKEWTRLGPLGMKAHILRPEKAKHTWLAAGRALLRSTDDGVTWNTIFAPKVPEERIVALHRATKADGRDGTLSILLERSAVVMMSEDDGKTWKQTKAPKLRSGSTWAVDFAADPANGDHLVIATRSTHDRPGQSKESGGVYETWDGGAKWSDITDNLCPGKKDDPAARGAKANWNRGRLVLLDPSSGLLLYGADGRGLFARAPIDPKSEKPKAPPGWIDLTPPGLSSPSIAAHVHSLTADKTDTLVVVQLLGANGETGMYSVNGKTLHALYKYALAAKKPDDKPEWATWPSPGKELTLNSLFADGQKPGRLVGTARGGGRGVLIYEVPGSTSQEPKSEPDDPKK